MKKIYALSAAVLASWSMANAQYVVTSDYDVVIPWDIADEYSADGLTITRGATATVKDFALNVAGFPKSYALGGIWNPITLSNGKVRFFDNPDFEYPTAENWEESEVSQDNDWIWDDCAGYASTSLNFDWVVDGEGNEIYLDSYCHLTGTLTGQGTLTIYATDKTTIDLACANTQNEACPAFIGKVIFKTLDGYTCDTLHVGTGFKVGVYGTGALGTKAYNGACMYVDLNELPGVVWKQTGANSLIIPAIKGNCTIETTNYPYFNGVIAMDGTDPVLNDEGATLDTIFEYDATINLAGSTTHDLEMYGNSLAFNAPINGEQRFFYVRSSAAVYFNSKEPSCSGFTNDVSQRGTGYTGGTGWADINYYPNSGRVNTLSAGYPLETVGEMTWKTIHVLNSNVIRFDFAGDKSDVLHATDGMYFNPGRNDVKLGFGEDYFTTAKPGHYRVISTGNLDAGYSTMRDTIGYEVWDNNGCCYTVRSVKGGEVISRKDPVTGETETYTALPGDSIGEASFGNLASKFGATCMDGNRPYYLVKNWGFGTYSDGKSVDEKYIGTTAAEYDGTYVINPDQIGTYARGAEGYVADSLAWEEVWAQFLAEHPVSDTRAQVSTEDLSVIPGTVGDSIFLTYSYYVDGDGVQHGAHAWSWKNGSGYEKGYPYCGAIEQAYYYYSSNTIYVDQSGSIVAPTGETVEYSWSKITLPETKYHGTMEEVQKDAEGNTLQSVFGGDSIKTVNDPATAYKSWRTGKIAVPQTDGSTINYWFDFNYYLLDGIISLCYEKVEADGTVSESNANEDGICTDEKPELDGLQTVLKETHAVKTRTIFTMDGKRVNTYQRGINVVTTQYTDGTIETKKVFFAE